MKKKLLVPALLLCAIAFSQPNSFVCGPAYYFGTGKFENLAFSRSHSIGSDGTPQTSFSNLQSAKFSSSAAGILMEVNKPHFHMGLDLALPLKGKFKDISGTAVTANWFNIALAWGGFIKQKYGIMGGISGNSTYNKYTPTTSSFADNANSAMYSPAASSSGLDYKADGRYYMTSYYKGTFGLDLHFIYAITEQFIFRASYSYLLTGVKLDKGATPPNGDSFKGKAGGSRFETGLFYQLSDNFGLFARYTINSVHSTSSVNTSVTTNGGSSRKDVTIFPAQSQRLGILAVGIMLPLGSATTSRTVITVTPK